MPDASCRFEIEKVKGSRFIATLAAVSSALEAEEFVREVRADFADARHTCYAWRLDSDGHETRANDDGEPAGSAGKPILKQIEGRELARTLVTVTRYFGGTKLGVGGLMRAYGAAAAAVLEAGSFRVVLRTERVCVRHPYECSGNVQGLLAAWKLEPSGAAYGELVELELEVPRSQSASFVAELTEVTAGRAHTTIGPDPR